MSTGDHAEARSSDPRLADHPHLGPIGGQDLRTWLAAYPLAAPPKRSIMLATVERCGSEFLCQLMGATGQLGRPSEYLNTEWMRRFIADYPDEVRAQLAIAHRVGTTTNGCFAMKLHPIWLDRLLSGARVEAAFPNPVFVRLFRRDLLAQAISLYRARGAGKYHAHIPARRTIDYDGAAIQRALIEQVHNTARWQVYFARNGLQPLAIAYEELVTNPDAAVRAIAHHAGIDVRPAAPTAPLQIQRDDVSNAWRQRFVAEFGNLNLLDRI
jgi:trehalose 2-sulfotransferase